MSALLKVFAAVTMVVNATSPLLAQCRESRWTPERVEVFCGTPAADTRIAEWDPSKDQEAPCSERAKSLIQEIEEQAEWSLQQLSCIGFRTPRNVMTRVATADGNAMRLYFSGSDDKIAAVHGTCAGGHLNPVEIAEQTFSFDPFERYRIVSHELVHLVHWAQPYRDSANWCRPPQWLNEGVADALSIHLSETRYRNTYRPPLDRRGSKSFYELRRMSVGFLSAEKTMRDRWGHKLVSPYRTSPFWRYLAERPFGRSGNPDWSYLATLASRKPPAATGANGQRNAIGWVDQYLREDSRSSHPFALLFADFAADYALWGEHKFGGRLRYPWIEESFRIPGPRYQACHEVALDPTNSTKTLEMEFAPISAQCLKIKVKNLEPADRASVDFLVISQEPGAADEIHLGTSRLSDDVLELGGRSFDCYREGRSRGGRYVPVCLQKPFTGIREGEAGSVGENVRTWLTLEQSTARGELDNLFIVSHAPPRPHETTHRADAPRKKYTLRVGLSLARFETSEEPAPEKPSSGGGSTPRKKPPEASVTGPFQTRPFPMRGSESPDGDVTKLPSMITDEMSHRVAEAMGPGVSMVTIRTEGEKGITLSLITERPIRFGDRGTHPAFVSGGIASAFENVGSVDGLINASIANVPAGEDEPSARIEVVEFSERTLHLRARGKYCLGVDVDRETGHCRDPQDFTAEIIRPFGWAYSGDSWFTSIDTPGQKDYRESLQESLTGSASGGGDAGNGSGAEPGDTGSGGGEVACDCSCENYERIAAIRKKMGEERRMPTAEEMRALQCSMSCMEPFAECRKARRRR